MIRLFIFFACITWLLHAKNDIDTKIKSTSSQLDSYSKNYKNISQKMQQNAKAIIQQKRKILQQQKYLKQLKAELKEKAQMYEANKRQLNKLKLKQSTLNKAQQKIQDELIFTISKSISISMILEEKASVNEDSIIEFEVLQAMLKRYKNKAKKLNDVFYKNAQNIDILNLNISSLEVAIAEIDSKQKKLIKAQEQNKKSLKKLKLAKAKYKKELKLILKKQDELKKMLAKLNLIKIDELKKAKEEEARKKAFNSKEILSQKNLPKVKKHGSSYQKVKTIEYLGAKTISPLKNYTITKRYGTYTDPIYGIKIFNESISLKPSQKDAKVRTVFNGKIIYADKTAVLNNVVVIEHKNGLHTIYANLSKIAPHVKKGQKIKKGYVIGRVSDELIFEVTRKSYHINPIRLFK